MAGLPVGLRARVGCVQRPLDRFHVISYGTGRFPSGSSAARGIQFSNLPESQAEKRAHQEPESQDRKGGDRGGRACVHHAWVRDIIGITGGGIPELPGSIRIVQFAAVADSVPIRIEIGESAAPDHGTEGRSRRREEVLLDLDPKGVSRASGDLGNVAAPAAVFRSIGDLGDSKGARLGVSVKEEKGKEQRKSKQYTYHDEFKSLTLSA